MTSAPGLEHCDWLENIEWPIRVLRTSEALFYAENFLYRIGPIVDQVFAGISKSLRKKKKKKKKVRKYKRQMPCRKRSKEKINFVLPKSFSDLSIFCFKNKEVTINEKERKIQRSTNESKQKETE